MRAWALWVAAALLSVAALSPGAFAQNLPPAVQPLYSGRHGAWEVACARVGTTDTYCNLGQGAHYEGGGPATLILGVHLRREGEYVFLHFEPGFKKDSDITFLTDKKDAGELKQVDGKTLRILPERSQVHIKQFMAGNILVVQFVPNGDDKKRIARFDLAGFTASMNDARAQLKAALGK